MAFAREHAIGNRSVEHKPAQAEVSHAGRWAVPGVLAVLAVLLLSFVAISAVPATHASTGTSVVTGTTTHTAAPAAVVKAPTPFVASVAAPLAVQPVFTGACAALCISGYNVTPTEIIVGQMTTLSVSVGGTGHLFAGAVLNYTYTGLDSCVAWCAPQNASSFAYTADAAGAWTVTVFANSTCGTVTPVACSATASVSFTVDASPAIAITSAANGVLTGPFAYDLAFTTTENAHDSYQTTESIQIFSVSPSTGQTYQFGAAGDVRFSVTTSPTPASWTADFTLADLGLPAGYGNLPAGEYWIGVQVADQNGTILVPAANDAVTWYMAQTTVGPTDGSVFTSGSVSISWAADEITTGINNELDISVAWYNGTANGVIPIGNEYSANGFAAGVKVLVLTVPGTYWVNLTAGPGVPYNVSTWFHVIPVPIPTCTKPAFYNYTLGLCQLDDNTTTIIVHKITWANTTFDNTTTSSTIWVNQTASGQVAGVAPNTLGAVLIVIGILVGGVIGIMAGRMMFGRKTGGGGGGTMESSGSMSEKKSDEFS